MVGVVSNMVYVSGYGTQSWGISTFNVQISIMHGNFRAALAEVLFTLAVLAYLKTTFGKRKLRTKGRVEIEKKYFFAITDVSKLASFARKIFLNVWGA